MNDKRTLTGWILAACVMLVVASQGVCQPTISGRVLNDSTGAGVVGIDLDVFDLAGNAVPVTGAISGIDGAYTLVLTTAGTYLVRVDPSRLDGFSDLYYDNVLFRSAATPIVVDVNLPATGIDFRLRPGFELRGRVHSLGTPVGDVDLDLYGANGEFLSGYPARTASDGSYAIGALPPGTYLLKADPDPSLGQFYVQQYYGGSVDQAMATPITIGGIDVIGVDVDLKPGGLVAGRIVGASDGLPQERLDLDIYDSAGARLPFTARTDADGYYQLGPLPAGEFFLRVDPTIAQGYPRIYYPNSVSQSGGTAVSVVNGQITSNIDFSLPRAGVIQGRIVDAATSTGLSGIDLDVFTAAGGRLDVSASSGVDGSYALGPLLAGQYVLRADPSLVLGYARLYYPAEPSPSTATPINVVAGASTGGIDFYLRRAGGVSGRVTDEATGNPLAGMDLDAFDSAGRRLDVSAKSGVDGLYTLGPLPVGMVYVRVDPGATQGFQHQYYFQGLDLTTATLITVEAATDTGSVDFTLQPAGWIAGSIRDAQSAPIAGIDLDLYDAATGDRVRTGDRSDIDGSFVIGPLPPGAYKVRADPDVAQGYAVQYFSNRPNKDLADPITVPAGAGTLNVYFILEAGGSLSGQVLAPQTGLPVVGADLDVLQAGTLLRLDQSRKTDLNGAFTVGPLPAGTYLLRADPPVGTPYLRTYLGGVATPDASSPVSLSGGQQLSGFTIRMLEPTGPTSAILSWRRIDGDHLEISFPTETGSGYSLESAPSLQSAVWDLVASGTGDGQSKTVTVVVSSGSQAFYRLRSP